MTGRAGMTGGMRYLELPTHKRYSVIGLGTWQFGSREWGYGREYDEHAAGEIVARARALGITVFDTAEIYGRGRSDFPDLSLSSAPHRRMDRSCGSTPKRLPQSLVDRLRQSSRLQ